MSKRLATVALAMLAVACDNAIYRDVSSENGLIGKQFTTREELLIHAVATDSYPKKVVDEYSMTPKPGFGGPEVISRGTLPVGLSIRILRVEECNNCLGRRTRLVVQLPGAQYADHPIYLSEEFLPLLQPAGGS